MPPWLPIAFQCLLFVLTVAMHLVNLVANLKLKFGPTQEAVTREWKQLAFGVGQWLLVIVLVASLIYTVLFNEKVTHFTVLAIALGVASLLFHITMFFIASILGQISKLSDFIIKTNESIKVVSDTVTLTDKASEDRLTIYKLQLKERELRSLLPDSDKVL